MLELPPELAEDRELRPEERTLVRWLLDHAEHDASAYLSQVDEMRVCSRCGCGCPSVNFRIGERGWPTKGGMKIVSDHDWVAPDGYGYGIFLFAHSGTLAGIDVYAQNAPNVARRLPTLAELETVLASRAAAAQSY